VEYDVEKAIAAAAEQGLPMIAQAPIPKVEVDESSLEAVLQLAITCDYEAGHTHQVTKLALKLFDELQPLHRLSAQERFWLNVAGLLHDIGWIEGQKGHHKTALRTILNAKALPFNNGERLIIGSIARYHRGALPKKKHGHFSALRAPQRHIVSILAAILRVADGLDRTHNSLVQDLSCEVTPEQILVRCIVIRPAEIERMFALKKGQLMEKVFNRELAIEWQQV
jgi:exopolyphosphatase/guanosine-5'-triphosphate,3'-diphosphate pyrophosphatase